MVKFGKFERFNDFDPTHLSCDLNVISLVFFPFCTFHFAIFLQTLANLILYCVSSPDLTKCLKRHDMHYAFAMHSEKL